MGDVLGGEDRRDEIYSWPVVNPCRVDQETLETAYSAPEELKKEAVNTRGLDAIEYLLFHPEGNDCALNSSINMEGTWVGLEAELPQRQASYAAAAAALVREEADALLARWDSSAGDYSATLKTAGQGSQVYGSLQEGLNAITDAMFYIDQMTKDMKVGEPVGFMECDTSTCPKALESRYAEVSKEAVLANLDGLALLFHGGADAEASTGFDDLLSYYNAEPLALDLSGKLVSAREAVQAVPGTFKEALAGNLAEMEAAYEALKGFTDLFKTQFLSVLDLEIPSRAASDND
jgi:predicted lipoprotein